MYYVVKINQRAAIAFDHFLESSPYKNAKSFKNFPCQSNWEKTVGQPQTK